MGATSIDLSQIKTDALDSKAAFKTLIEAEGEVSLDNLREYFPTIANNSTDSEHDLDIDAARIWVSDGTDERLVDFTAQVKRIDATWAAGTNQGGLDTGTVANDTWYYIWAIYNPTTDTADYLLSASQSSPTMPSGYTYKRRVRGAVRTNGSANIRAFTQRSDFFHMALTADFEGTATNGGTLVTTTVPPSMLGSFYIYRSGLSGAADFLRVAHGFSTFAPGLAITIYVRDAVLVDTFGTAYVDGSSRVFLGCSGNTSGTSGLYCNGFYDQGQV
jgi:hypothetical protein